MLSAIVQKVTGQTVLEYLTPRMLEPLGIENPKWETSPQGISIGGYGLFLRTEDMQAELNVVWNKLLPAFSDKPQAENPTKQARLKEVIAGLEAIR